MCNGRSSHVRSTALSNVASSVLLKLVSLRCYEGACGHTCRTDESIQVLQSYYSAMRLACTDSGNVHHTSQTLSTLIRLCLASARLNLRDTTDVIDCMLAIRLVEESLNVVCSGTNEKMFGEDLHGLVHTADAYPMQGIDQYLQHLAHGFAGTGKGCELSMANEE